MEKQQKNRKPLIVGIIAVVVILAILLALLLTQCTGGRSDDDDATGQTTTAPQAQTSEGYTLYWNVDRELYDGMSEAGMSSRPLGEDGYFHVTFAVDGEQITLKVADRKVVNAIEIRDVMGLVFDDQGIVIDVIDIDDMPCQQVAWQFYVQSAATTLIKANSSSSLNGMEILIEVTEDTGIYDMTGLSGPVGCEAEPIYLDRILAVANEDGVVTHVFIYDRSEYMLTHEAECEHCGKVVTWYEWTKESSLPINGGHYQLQNDIALSGQMSMVEDAKICLDLNGKTVDGKKNARMYSLHNPGTELAIMDTSEEKTGKLAAHGTGDQGMCVWLRYGVFYLYDGILDASDAATVKNGTTVAVSANTYFYMNGGELIGGTAKYTYNESTGKYGMGLGGTMTVSGKFVLNDGIIRDGYAQEVSYYKAGATSATIERGIGGNIILLSGSVMEMNGGVIKNGTAGNTGGNIYMDGTAEFIMNDGRIEGGRLLHKGKNGGSVYVTSKSTFQMNGGIITGGTCYNTAANVYTNGKFIMAGGVITGGRILDYETGKVKTNTTNANLYVVNGRFEMYGGTIYGSAAAVDSTDNDKSTVVVLSGYATITSPDEDGIGLSLYNGISGAPQVECYVGTLLDGAKIGISTSYGIFTKPCKESNLDNFYSDVEGVDVVYYNGCLALGKLGCLCGSNSENDADHKLGCDGTQLFWAPWTSTTTLPTVSGNYCLINDVTMGNQATIAADSNVVLDLNGKTVTGPNGNRIYSLHFRTETENEDGTVTYAYNSSLTITDTSAEQTGKMVSRGTSTNQASIVWLRYGDFTLIAGTLDASSYTLQGSWTAGADGIWGTSDDTTSSRGGSAIEIPSGRTFTMYGGTVIGGTVDATLTNDNVEKDEEGNVTSTTTVSKTVSSCNGGTINLNGTIYMYGGTISGGYMDGGTGGNIRINSSGKMYMYGGTVTSGTSTGNGGNIQLSGLLELYGGTIENGWSKNTAGNIHVSPGTLTMYGGTITGGMSGSSGNATSNNANIFCVNGTWNLFGGTVDGYARVINYNTDGATGGSTLNIKGSPVVSSGIQNINLAPQDDKTGTKDDGKTPTMPVINVVGAMGEDADIKLTLSNYSLDFGVGDGYTLVASDGEAFTADSEAITDCAAVDTENNSLFFGKMGCLCGKEEHTEGCLALCGGEDIKWHPWTSTDSLPTNGSYYLTGDVTPGQTSIAVGSDVKLDLNGYNISSGNRVYRAYNANSVVGGTLTITNTGTADETHGVIKTTKASGTDQGGVIWFAGSEKSTFNLLDGVTLDSTGYKLTNNDKEKNGGTVSIGSTNTFNMYGGTIIGATCVTPTQNGTNLTYASNGGAVAIEGGTMNMYGGLITGGSTENDGGNLYITGTVNMYGGEITDGIATKTAGNVFVQRSGTLNMYGDAKISGGTSTSSNSGNVRVDGKMTMTDNAIVTGGTSATSGGNIMVNFITSGGVTYYGTLEMSGNASVTDGTTYSTGTAQGGNIKVNTGATMTATDNVVISGGTVNGSSGKEPSGGNLYIGGTVILSGNVQILNGTSYHTAGNIRVSGGNLTIEDNVLISGGKISNDKVGGKTPTEDMESANIFCNNGTVTMTGGTVVGGMYFYATATTTLNLSGNVNISSDAHQYDLRLGGASGSTLTVNITGALTGGENSIGVWLNAGTGIIAYGKDYTLTETDRAAFYPSNEAAEAEVILTEDNTLILGRVSCVCGATDGNHNADVCDGTMHYWTAWTSSTLPTTSGYYYLIGDLKVTNYATVVTDGLDITLDLNGHTITSTTNRLYTTYGGSSAATNGKLNLMFTNTDANSATIKVTGNGDQGRVIWMRGENKTVTVYNLDIDMSESTTKSTETDPKNGQAFALDEQKSGNTGNYLNLYNVDITGGTRAANGGLIYGDWNAHVLMKDSTISGSSVTVAPGATTKGGNGGAIFLQHNATLEMIDSSITGCTAEKLGGAIYTENYNDSTGPKLTFSGKVVIEGNQLADGTTSNIHMSTAATILIGADGLDADSSIGLTGTANDSLSTAVAYADKGYFISDNSAYELAVLESGLTLVAADAHVHCVCDGTIANGTVLADGTVHNCVDVLYEAWTSTSGTISSDVSWYLTDDLTLDGQLSSGQYTMNLCLNGHNVTTSSDTRMIRTYGANQTNGKITLTTCQSDVYSDGKLINNTISQKENTLSDNGDGGIFWVTNNGTLEMYAGTLDASMYALKPNASDKARHGCAVSVEYGSTFKMYGGTIIGGTTKDGTDNNSEGPSVFLIGSMTMYGGTIRDGKTEAGNGGNIFVNGGSFAMYGGTISGGTANFNGGNIFVCDRTSGTTTYSGTVLIAGGTVTGGTAGTRGGNIFASCNGLTISGGTISDGTATDAGNVGMPAGRTVTMTGGTISGGSASSVGGNLYVMGTLNMSGGTITGGMKGTNLNNTTANIGINGTGTLNMSGGTITGRVGAIQTGSKLNLSGTARIYDTEKTNNLYVKYLTVTVGDLTGGAIIGLLYHEGYPTLDAAFASAADGYTITEEDAARFVFSNSKYEVELSEDGKQLIARAAG